MARIHDQQRLAEVRAVFPEWSAGRILSALGHPGYGDTFAAAVLARVEHDGDDVWRAKSSVFNEMGVQ